jgi:hypothetical protein
MMTMSEIVPGFKPAEIMAVRAPEALIYLASEVLDKLSHEGTDMHRINAIIILMLGIGMNPEIIWSLDRRKEFYWTPYDKEKVTQTRHEDKERYAMYLCTLWLNGSPLIRRINQEAKQLRKDAIMMQIPRCRVTIMGLTDCLHCFFCDKELHKKRSCGGCMSAHYCSVDCQQQDWKRKHKDECKELKQNASWN